MSYRLGRLLPLLCFVAVLHAAAPNVTRSDAVSVAQELEALPVTGSVLMIAAHPDDENTALISYLARGRKVRTAYLSLTRGEGGQNVIGSEKGPELGVIRTQELLASRRVDGAQQFFSRAIDFGFTKTPQETLEKWGHDAVLGDIVWVIRKFRPDVVILQFTGTYRDGHGQHQASAILGREAYSAAADPARFPEQLKYVRPWHATRLMVNRRGFTEAMQQEINALPGRLDIELGQYDPVIGYSYGELAGVSRSFNSSQSDGTPRVRGHLTTTLVTLSGPPATNDLFEGIDLTWKRFRGGAEVDHLLAEANAKWDATKPWDIIPVLERARSAAVRLDDPAVPDKIKAIDETIADCAGLWLDFSADREQYVAGTTGQLRITAIQRSAVPAVISALNLDGHDIEAAKLPRTLRENEPAVFDVQQLISASNDYTAPYWLIQPPSHNLYQVKDMRLIGLPENPPPLLLRASVRIGDTTISLERPLTHRYINRLRGESITPVAYVPPASVRFLEDSVLFPSAQPKQIQVEVTSHLASGDGSLRLEAPAGWAVTDASRKITFHSDGERQYFAFTIHSEDKTAPGELKAVLNVNGKQIDRGLEVIDYPHITRQVLFPEAAVKVVRTNAITLAKHVGYIMGSGDDVPRALRQLGCQVTILDGSDVANGDLSQYDAIVTGIRAFTERPDLVANESRLLDYVSRGGTLVVQYNRIERGSEEILRHMGPYPFQISHDRVTVEEAPVEFDATSPLLKQPNKITAADFDGWVQERGLYFASSWDTRYSTPFEMHDPGEAQLKGATLVTKYGKGVYIFTAFSWFRELPAGVPGAYRIFANFLSASKTMQ